MRTSFYPFSSIVQCPWVNFKSDIQIFPNCTIPIDKVVTKLITSFSSPSLTNNLYQVRSGCNIFYLSLHNTWSNAGVGGGVGCIIHNISLNSLSLSLSLLLSTYPVTEKLLFPLQHYKRMQIYQKSNILALHADGHRNAERRGEDHAVRHPVGLDPPQQQQQLLWQTGQISEIVHDICCSSKMYCYSPWHVLLVSHKNCRRCNDNILL